MIFLVLGVFAATGGGLALYVKGWESGYVVGKHSEFREAGLCAMEQIRALKDLDEDQAKARGTLELNITAQFEKTRFLDEYINSVSERGVSFPDMRSLSTIRIDGEAINGAAARDQDLERLRKEMKALGFATASPK